MISFAQWYIRCKTIKSEKKTEKERGEERRMNGLYRAVCLHLNVGPSAKKKSKVTRLIFPIFSSLKYLYIDYS